MPCFYSHNFKSHIRLSHGDYHQPYKRLIDEVNSNTSLFVANGDSDDVVCCHRESALRSEVWLDTIDIRLCARTVLHLDLDFAYYWSADAPLNVRTDRYSRMELNSHMQGEFD